MEKVEAKLNARVVVTFIEEEVAEDGLRDMASQANGFDFWNDPKEDIYQDFMVKGSDENR